MKKENQIYLIYVAIVVLQILNIIYWANIKTNYHIDELYSMGYASSYTGLGDTAKYITTSEEWEWNEWIPNAELKKYLCLADEEEIFRLSLAEVVDKILNDDSYSGLLNLAESLWGYRYVTKWPGILLNLLFFIVAELVLLVLTTRLKMSRWSIGLLLSMFGFCGYFVGLVEYIRFYMLVMMMVLVMIFLHYMIWTSDKLWQIVICEMGGLAMAYLGLKNSQLTLVYAGALLGCFCIALLFTRQWKKLGVYVLMPFIAVIYLACKTEWLKMLFHIGNYVGANNQRGILTANIVSASPQQVIDYLIWVIYLLTYSYFGHHFLAMLWSALCVGLFLIVFRSCGRNLLQLDHEDGFALVLTGTLVIYTLFAALAGISLSRYYSFGVITFVIIMWYVINRMMRQMQSKWMLLWYGLLTVLTVMSCFAPLLTRNVEYIYEQDQELIGRLQDYQGTDTVLVPITDVTGDVSRHEIYDCVNLLDEETRILPINLLTYTYNGEIFPNKFILWTQVDHDIEKLITALEMEGYQVEKLAVDHVSKAYVCEKP